MVKVDITAEEAQSYVELMKDAKCPPEMGYLLTSLKFKIFKAFQKDKEDRNKEVAKKMLEEEQKHSKTAKKKKEDKDIEAE